MRMRAPHLPSIRDWRPHATQQGRPRSSQWLPKAADRTALGGFRLWPKLSEPTGLKQPDGAVCTVMSQAKDRKPAST